MKKNKDEFYEGILRALSIIKKHNAETIFRDVADSVDTKELIRHARKNGQMRWSGLLKYGYGGPDKMNEIKFKAVKKDSQEIYGKTYDVVGIKWDENGKITSVFVNNADVIEELFPDDIELLQYIMLKDNKDREIYSGDILRDCEGMKWIVFYDNECGWYRLQAYNDKEWVEDIPDNLSFDFEKHDWIGGVLDMEIIGNRYINPELVEDE